MPMPRAVVAQKLGLSKGKAEFLERRTLASLRRRFQVPRPSSDRSDSFYTGADSYGRNQSAPILVDGLDRQVAFLAKLVHEQSSKALIFHRRQSMARPGAGPLDVYEIVTAGGEHWDELLVDGYAPAGEAPPRPPPGYIFRRQMAVESRPEPNRGDNRHHRDFPLAFLHPDEAPEHHRRPHRPKVWMFDST